MTLGRDAKDDRFPVNLPKLPQSGFLAAVETLDVSVATIRTGAAARQWGVGLLPPVRVPNHSS
jgi:hypothetical protein